jgi:hypothetical protein
MSEHSQDKEITVRVIRDGSPELPDKDWSLATPEERFEAVWTLTKLCWAWNNPSEDEPRMQKHITRVIRGKREDQETTN